MNISKADIDTTATTTLEGGGDIRVGCGVTFGVNKTGTLTTTGWILTSDNNVTFSNAVTFQEYVGIDTTVTSTGNLLFCSTGATGDKNLTRDASRARNNMETKPVTLDGPVTTENTLKINRSKTLVQKPKVTRGTSLIKILFFLLFFTGKTANLGFGQEVTTNEFFEEMRRVEARQSKFLEEKAEIEEALEKFESQREKAFENYARVSGSRDPVAVQEAKSEYIVIRSKMIDEEHKMVKKALDVYFQNTRSLNGLYKKFKEEADQSFEGSPKEKHKLRTDLARLSFFIENLKNISRTLGQPGAILSRDSGLKAKMDATSLSAMSILRFINFENKRSGPNPSNAALTALEKHISTVETGYLAYKDHFRSLEREKARAQIAIRVARSELGILTFGGQGSFPDLKQNYTHKNKIYERRRLEDEQVLF